MSDLSLYPKCGWGFSNGKKNNENVSKENIRISWEYIYEKESSYCSADRQRGPFDSFYSRSALWVSEMLPFCSFAPRPHLDFLTIQRILDSENSSSVLAHSSRRQQFHPPAAETDHIIKCKCRRDQIRIEHNQSHTKGATGTWLWRVEVVLQTVNIESRSLWFWWPGWKMGTSEACLTLWEEQCFLLLFSTHKKIRNRKVRCFFFPFFCCLINISIQKLLCSKILNVNLLCPFLNLL